MGADKVSILGSNISVWDLAETVTRLRELSDGGDVKVQQNNNRNRNRPTTKK